MEELFNELIIQTRQRAGLMAVIMGIFMTSKDEDTKRTMAIVLNQIFEDHPVDDDLEKIIKELHPHLILAPPYIFRIL
jgi:hypothetical protein